MPRKVVIAATDTPDEIREASRQILEDRRRAEDRAADLRRTIQMKRAELRQFEEELELI